MIKNIFFILAIVFIIFSCGKKGDPKYKESNNNTSIKIILLNKV
tara:strand:+ start:262 stop:393 length:132 start_codon:yes stop_codon:yes gene_type:complete